MLSSASVRRLRGRAHSLRIAALLLAGVLGGGGCCATLGASSDGSDSGDGTADRPDGPVDPPTDAAPEPDTLDRGSEPNPDGPLDFGGETSEGGGIGSLCGSQAECGAGLCCFCSPCDCSFMGSCLPGAVMSGCCVPM